MKNKILGAIALSAMILLSSCKDAQPIGLENTMVLETKETMTATMPIPEPVPYRTDNYTNFDFPYVLDYIDRSKANINNEYATHGYCAVDNGDNAKTIHYVKAIYNDYNSAIIGCGLGKDPSKTGYVYNISDYDTENKIIDMGSNPDSVSSTLADTHNTLCPTCFYEDKAEDKFQQYLDNAGINIDYTMGDMQYVDINHAIVEHSDYTKFQDGYNEYWTNPDSIYNWDYMPHIHTTFSYAEIPNTDGTQTIHAVKSVQNLEQFAVVACDKDLAQIDWRDNRLSYRSIKQFTHDSIATANERINLYTDPTHTLCPTCFDSEQDVEKLLNHAQWLGLDHFSCQVQDNDGFYKMYGVGENTTVME
ncbi:MAG: hypothetical protein E7361_02345 [Clostridiales bacterium]|nr:hypothetical protein [Clostridiales bacterium]